VYRKKESLISVKELKALLTLTSAGNGHAFFSLVDLYWNTVYSQAVAYTRSPQLSEELTQDIFMRIWNCRDRLPALESFENFLFIIARNAIISAMRRSREPALPGHQEEHVEQLWQPDRQLENKEQYDALLRVIDLLPPQRKRVLILSRIEGLSHEEIALQLGISKNTIKEHIIKGLNFIRNYFYKGPTASNKPPRL
jgi:RNA polymerase sigma-70 factor (family 1)